MLCCAALLLATTLPVAAPDATLLLRAPPRAPAQDAPAAGQAGGAGSQAPAFERPKLIGTLPKVEAPPALTPAKIEGLKREIPKLRATNPDALAGAQKGIIAFGRGALPVLVEASTTKHPGQMECLVNCLTQLADLRDRDLVASSFASPLPVLERFAAREAGEDGLPELVDKVPPLLTDSEPLVRLEAALALLRNGREEGLTVVALAFDGPDRARILATLPGIAGQGPHQALADMLRIDPQREKEEADVAAKERLNAVLLLHAIGDKAAQALLVTALDDKHNVVQREAINSLRDLLEHQGPLDKSSIFQQINEVKRLKDLWATLPPAGAKPGP